MALQVNLPVSALHLLWASQEHRTSGKDVTDTEWGSDDRRLEQDGHLENKDSSNLARRHSLTHNHTKKRVGNGKKNRDSDRDMDHGRDRHSDRDWEKERDRDWNWNRDRERDRERERDWDCRRRDDKDCDRDSWKEHNNTANCSLPQCSDLIPTRKQDSSRWRDNSQTNGETDSLGKRSETAAQRRYGLAQERN